MQLGKIAEYYAQIELISLGFEVYDTVVDDRGIDFIARKNGKYYEIQVKSVRNFNYTFISKSKMPKLTVGRTICYMNFVDGSLPVVYLIPSTVWLEPNDVFQYKEYTGLKSASEYGINISRKNIHLLDNYIAEKFFVD